MNSLEERLARLEQNNRSLEATNRRQGRWGLAGVGLLGAVVLMGQAASDDKNGGAAKFKSIEAGEITLVGEGGKGRVEIGVDKDGTGLDVRDAKGVVRLTIGLDKDGAGLDIRDAAGKTRVSIGEGTADGHKDSAGAWVFDAKGRRRVGLGVGEGGGGLIVLDENGNPVAAQGK
jgi:hypothetical protein